MSARPAATPEPRLRLVSSQNQLDDAALVRRAVEGDLQAFRALYDRHVQAVAGLCLRLLQSHTDAEEVVQEGFLVAYRKLDSLREPERFRTWLVTIMVRGVRQRRRRLRFMRAIGVVRVDVPLESLAAPESSEEARSELRALEAALRTLPDKQRTAWLLRHVEEQPLDVVAEGCGCSLATVKRILADANGRVERHLRRAPRATEDA